MDEDENEDTDVGGSGDGQGKAPLLSLSPTLGETPEEAELTNYDVETPAGEMTVKVICLGDSAVGKSK
jgi:hypothetical protein